MHSAGAVLSHAARFLLCGLAAGTLALACGGTTTQEVVGPTASRCQIAVAAPPPVSHSASNVSLTVSAARDCTWNAASETSWLTVTPASGQGNGAVAVSVAANSVGNSRAGAVTVNEQRVTITQDGVPCRFELASDSTRVGHTGGRTSVRVSTIEGCAWSASGSTEWARLQTTSGTGSGVVDVEISPNNGPERTTTLSIAGSSFVVVQDAMMRDPATCSFSLDPGQASFRAGSGQGSVRVVTEAACPWTASADGWISLQRSNGSGPDTLSYQVSANTSTTGERSGAIVVAGRTHRVTQQACDLSIESGSPHLPPESGTYDFRVTTGSGCTWTASSTVNWIMVNTSRGTGSGVVSYRLAANPDRGREGTIVVSGRVKMITQYGSLASSPSGVRE